MKKNISLLVIFAVCASAALTAGCGGNNEETISAERDAETTEEESVLEKMAYPNLSEGILYEHENYTVNKAFYDEEGNIVSEHYYIDENMFAYETDSSYVHIMEDGQGFGYDSDAGMYFKDIFVGDAYETNFMTSRNITVYAHDETETVVSETEEEDGLKLAETVYEFDTDELTEEEQNNLANVEALVYNYHINPDTYEIVSLNVYTRTADGVETLINSAEVNYDTEPYEVSAELSAAVNGEDFRTTTIIADPGTDKETVYSQTITKGEGLGFMLYLPEGYTGIYTDEGCTEAWSGDVDYENDVTLYAAEGK
ncbi:MAG: hypothetical protein LUD77_06735 [Clostridiales bacterium]|nr:hypothetical protein [Clostridiales bacterium]